MTVIARWAPVVDRYVICGLPERHQLWDYFAVLVTRADGDVWTVKARGTYHISRDGERCVMLSDDDWGPYLMPLEQALEVATTYAKAMTLRGRTAEQILEEETRGS